MPYCRHCGHQIEDGAKFCSNCGIAISESMPNQSVRTQVFQGEVRKCPACGAEVPSFTAVCPECGHEFTSGRVTSIIHDFTEKLHEYDTQIANTPTEKSGWSTWNNWGKIGWVILNIFTFFVPVLIYFIKIKKFKADAYSQQKVSFIENYVFSNERETVLEALLFIKAQLATIAQGSIDGAGIFWERIWRNKATQLQQKAEIIMPADPVASQVCADIVALERKFNRRVLIRRILTALLVILAVYIFFNNMFS